MKILSVAATVGFLGSCGDPVAPDDVPPALNDRMIVAAVLDPDSARQVIEVAAADHYARPYLSDLRATIHRRELASGGSTWTLVAQWDSAHAAAVGVSLTDIKQCQRLHDDWASRQLSLTRVESRYCLTPEARLDPGATYRVEVTADGRLPASGETTVVGDFAVEVAALSGTRGSYALSASWTPSTAAYRYFMAVRRRSAFCPNCVHTWYADVEEARYSGSVPDLAVDSAGPDPQLDVVALDRHLHAFLTTGHRGLLNSSHPVQNVRNGFGVVGSARFRNRKLDLASSLDGSQPGSS